MATPGNLHKIYKIQRVIQCEWEIKDISILDDKIQDYESPEFSFDGVVWQIRMAIFPYLRRMGSTAGWMGLYLVPTSLPKPVTMTVSFSFKNVDGKKHSELTHRHLFVKEKLELGFDEFFSWSELILRQPELLPYGNLTVICTLSNGETDMNSGIVKLQQNLQEILLNGDASDVILKVKDQEFKSHRSILAARSPVFSAMMKSEMKESVTGVVNIEDVDPGTFPDFLKYLYTGNTEVINSENVTKLYIVADRYQVEVLKDNCLDYMLVNVTIENFCDIFIISVQHNEEKLKETCIQYFAKHSLDIIKTCKWQTFLSENPIICNELYIKHIEMNKEIYALHCNTCQNKQIGCEHFYKFHL